MSTAKDSFLMPSKQHNHTPIALASITMKILSTFGGDRVHVDRIPNCWWSYTVHKDTEFMCMPM